MFDQDDGVEAKINWLCNNETVTAWSSMYYSRWTGAIHTRVKHFDCTTMGPTAVFEELLDEMILFVSRLERTK
jgi:hypothetical protein